MKILIVHPSRNRANLAARAAHKWLTSAANPDNIGYVLSLDTDESQLSEYHDYTKDMAVNIITNPNKTAIEAINKAVSGCWDLLIVVSDDFNQPPFHWDKMLTEALKGKSDYIVKTDDGAQPWIITLPIMDRVYYERFGYVYDPDFIHLFCDTALSHIGAILGRTITLPIKIPHNHYSTGLNRKDAINEKNDATWEQGKRVYFEKLFRYFDIPESQRVNQINYLPKHHLDWLKSEGITFEVKAL